MATTLKAEQNERVKKALRGIVDTRFEGSVTRAAAALGISHSAVIEILSGTRGSGFKAVTAIARYLGKSVDELVSGSVRKQSVPETALGSLAGWAELRAEAEIRYAGKLDHEVIDDVERMSFARPPERLSVEDVKRLHDMLVDIYSRNPKAKEAARRGLPDK